MYKTYVLMNNFDHIIDHSPAYHGLTVVQYRFRDANNIFVQVYVVYFIIEKTYTKSKSSPEIL